MAAEITSTGLQLSRSSSDHSSTPTIDRETPQKSMEGLAVPNDRSADEDVEKVAEEENDASNTPGETNYFVQFDGHDDPDNPKNWKQGRRWAITVSMSMLVFNVTFASSIFSVNIGVVQEKFGVSMVEATLGVALFVLVCIIYDTVL